MDGDRDLVELYLVRHAVAAERGPEWSDDDVRPLTDRGIARFRKAVAGLAVLDLGIEEVLTSPLVRARQTAELLAAGVPEHPRVATLEALAPGHSPPDIASAIVGATRRRCLALVGHEPDLGALAAFLIGARQAIPLKKGGVCRIDVRALSAGPSGVLVWLATPTILRRLAP